jgi:hypothetical protein
MTDILRDPNDDLVVVVRDRIDLVAPFARPDVVVPAAAPPARADLVETEIVVLVRDRADIIDPAGRTTDLVVFGGPSGVRGETGEPGPPGSATSLLEGPARVGGLSGHQAVYLTNTGVMEYASYDQVDHGDELLGVTPGATSAGLSATAIAFGPLVEPTWNWTVGSPVYLGLNGALTQTYPTSPGADFSRVIGYPLNSTTLFISCQPAIYLA